MAKRGTELEQVIKLIQESLEPDAKVEHDVHLPVLISPSGRKRQCDTVIISGPKHRKTLTIVEVQDRSSQVKINTFNGWLGKLDETGAQHLVCVSRLGYPESIKEKAATLGNKVKLITLKSTDPTEIPKSFFKSSIKYCNFRLIKLNSPNLYFPPEVSTLIKNSISASLKRDFKSDEKIFSFDKITLKSLYNLCRDSCENLDVNSEGNKTLELGTTKNEALYLNIEGQFIRVELRIEFSWKNEVQIFPFSILSYEQQGDGSLAWMFECKINTQNGPIAVKIPFIKKGRRYKVPGIVTDLSPSQSYSIQIIKDLEN